MEKEIYFYLVSEGEYSTYTVEYLLYHTKRFHRDELYEIIEEMKKRYIAQGGNTETYSVDEKMMHQIFKEIIEERGFKIIYPAGEFHLAENGLMDNYRTGTPWIPRDTEPSMLRIGLG